MRLGLKALAKSLDCCSFLQLPLKHSVGFRGEICALWLASILPEQVRLQVDLSDKAIVFQWRTSLIILRP